MNIRVSQLGFTYTAVIVVIISLATIGALGSVFYQNIIQKEKISTNKDLSGTKNISLTTNDSTVKSTPSFIFTYPETEWINTNDIDQPGTIFIYTTDYISGPMGTEKGSGISIGVENNIDNIPEFINSSKTKSMIKDLTTITVDGQVAYKYLFSYEFGYYNTLFEKNGINYHVTLNGPNDESLKVYETVLATLKVK